ncbi:FAD-binding domain-containing protein [Dacryopinax primogenitus]|uniref:FAD-binding domain-containing protein n=1 Tax=Dacryopinax primogenitus (strain DJM 731) TaxID=1858805 RepID=M5FUU5_DACPD|nr:FAD-binding domain-containing protein [Dacryopinax primogenitus]EJU00029.1 FAD-binding domain-containing protein [Dacryopinax primogenitus]
MLLLLLLALNTLASPSQLQTCLTSLSFPVLLPSSPSYAPACQAYNRRLTFLPSSVVYPRTPAEVALAVRCASSASVPVVARSGGHGYAAFALGGQDGSLVVDLSGLKGVEFDNGGEVMHAQTGNRLGEIASALKSVGRALPHGTCVLLSGVSRFPPRHAAFGGFGFASREWGLLLDRMIGAELVLADGRIVNASLEENEDLFWAVRGSVSSFGIATSYTFLTLPEPPVTTAYSYVFSGNASSAAQCFLAFQAFSASSAPPPLGMQFFLIPDLTYELFGSYTGPKAAFEDVFLPLVLECEKTSDTHAGTHAFAQEMGWEAYLVSQVGTPPRVADCFYAKSLMTSSTTPLSQQTVEKFMHYLFTEGPKHPHLAWFVEVDLYGREGSAINAVPKLDTAFRHRDRLLGFQLYASSGNLRPPFPEDGYAFVDGMAEVLSAAPEGRTLASYANYVDPRLGQGEWEDMYYGGEIYDRLRKVKSKWDKGNVFRFPQGIVPSEEREGEGRRVVDEL